MNSTFLKMITALGVFTAVSFAFSSAHAADIVDTATQAGNFTTLLSASQSVGADAMLRMKGPYTVFAPNDAAFAKLPEEKRAMILAPQNADLLKQVLGGHVVFGNLSQADIDAGLSKADAAAVTASNNMPLIIKHEGESLTVNGARILGTGLKVDNGYVYTIDTVIIPPMPLQPTF